MPTPRGSEPAPAGTYLPPRPIPRAQMGAFFAMLGVMCIGALTIGPFSRGSAPSWPYGLLLPGAILLSSFSLLDFALERRRRREGALQRAMNGKGDRGLGACLATGVLLGVAVGGQRPALVLSALAAVVVVGFGPLIVWSRVRRHLPHQGRDLRKYGTTSD